MQTTKIKSFTLSELLVVMIITVIVVGLAFSVLSLVQKQIRSIEKNYKKTTELSLLEQRLWQDFNSHSMISYSDGKIIMLSDIDSVFYSFKPDYSIRNKDTINLKLTIGNAYYMGNKVNSGFIDAVSVSANQELQDYFIFVSSQKDAAHFINQNGF